ncbi:MAG: hypothetical protein WCP06_00515 [Verrucomicrobiota bacterium]
MAEIKPRGDVDWEKAKIALEAIQKLNPAFTLDNSIIGGAAAWFYKSLLQKENDPDFPCPNYSGDEEKVWLSRDLDFIGTRRDKLAEELQTQAEGDPAVVVIAGVWVDTPNEGLFLTSDRAAKTALEIRNPSTQSTFKVASPTLLYREKKELLQHKELKDRPQDRLHLGALERAAKLVLCKLAEESSPNEKQPRLLFKLLKEAQEIAPEIIEDQQVLRRLARQLDRIGKDPNSKALFHLLQKQILTKWEK